MNTDQTNTLNTDRYPAALTDMQAAEVRLTAARKAADEAAARLDAKRTELARLQNSKAALLQLIAHGEGDPTKLPKIDTDLAAVAAVVGAMDQTAAALQGSVTVAERTVFDAERAVRKALLRDWPPARDALQTAALDIVAVALRAWWRAERASCGSFPGDSVPAEQWLMRGDVRSALAAAIESAPDMPCDRPWEAPRSDLLTEAQRGDMEAAERLALAA
jgi:hypothetical protein